jgi:four helix bundle protein
MSGVERFEDLIAWQEARVLTRRIYEVSKEGEFARDFRLASQMQAASVSIMSNIAEGFERHSTAEFHQFLKVAKGSCAEVRSQLYVALDARYIDSTVFEELQEKADEVGRVTGGLRASVGRLRDAAR